MKNKYDERLNDNDLEHILEYENYSKKDVKKVLACIFGEKEGPSWHYIIELRNGRFVYLTGWCDYTGWGCRDGSESKEAETALKAANLASEDDYDSKNVKQQLKDQIKGKQPYGLQI